MPRRSPQLAKLTRPRSSRAVGRERLFTLLDQARETKSAICVVGPPGAGKTTLVTSWLNVRNIKGIWYQVDGSDADLATFFFYLGQAVRPFSGGHHRPLPLLTPEYLADVEGFSRRYFRALFSRLPQGATVVLDNYQEVSAGQAFHKLVAEAVGEIPRGVTLIVLSRRDPPQSYARLVANEQVAVIDWQMLKLNPEEAQSIATERVADASQEDVARLHQMSEGWAAGFTLLLEQLRQGQAFTVVGQRDSLGAVFDYFAGQLFDRAAPDTRRLLLRLSYLPRMSTRSAGALTGSTDAGPLLEDLHRRHLFTDRREAGEPVYQFHALLQAFLQHRASQLLSLPEQSELTQHAARLLEQSAQPEEALPLFLKAGHIDAAQALILREAPKLIGQGRWKVVVEWTQALPQQRVESDCWLMHWLGTAHIMVAPPRARELLEQSSRRAQQQDDSLCLLQAAAGIVQTYMLEYVQYRPLDRWIDILEEGLDRHPTFPESNSELRVYSALLVALAYRRPSSPTLADCAQRTLALAQANGEINLRALAAAYVVAYGTTTGPLELARRARPLLERLLSDPGVTALTAAWGGFITSYAYQVTGEETQVLAAVRRVEQIGMDEGLPAAVRLAAIIGSWVEAGAGRTVAAWQWLRRLEEVAVPGNLYDEASIASLKAQLYALQGEAKLAGTFAARAMELYDDAGTHFHRCYSRTQKAWAALIVGDIAGARRWIAEGLALAQETRTGWLELELRLVEAYLADQLAQPAILEEKLRTAFALGRQIGCMWGFKFSRAWMPLLCAKALQAAIEPDYVKSVVRCLQLQPPEPGVKAWPWPIQIYTLGRFEILLSDQPLRFSRKTPRKPLTLLKTLIALGGVDVPEHRLVDALWSEEEGDAARKAYNIALYRLRELLGKTDAVTVEGGAVSLNRDLCWVDVWQTERHLAEAQACLRNADSAGFAQAAEEVGQLYRGAFLAADAEAQWAVSTRERLRGRFVQFVEAAGNHLEAASRFDQARDWYLRGLDADDLAEAFYQGLMRCYEATGRRSEGLSVFRRLRHTLSITLGIVPSEQSEALHRRLLAS